MEVNDQYAEPIANAIWKAAQHCTKWGVVQFDVLSLPKHPGSRFTAGAYRWNHELAKRVLALLVERGARGEIFTAPQAMRTERVIDTVHSPRGKPNSYKKEKCGSPREKPLVGGQDRYGIHFMIHDAYKKARDGFVKEQVKRLLPVVRRVFKLNYQSRPIQKSKVQTLALKLPLLARCDLRKDNEVLTQLYDNDPDLVAAFRPEQYRLVPHTELLYQRVMNDLDAALEKEKAMKWPGVYWRIRTMGETMEGVNPGCQQLPYRDWKQLPRWQEYIYIDHIHGKAPWKAI